MNILNGKLPERFLRMIARRPMVTLSAMSLSLKVGRDAVHLKSGKIDSPEFRRRTGGSVGAVGLGAAGSYAGLVAGHFIMPIPILGGLVGGFAGGALGEILGDRLGRGAVERAEKVFTKTPSAPAPADDAAPTPPKTEDSRPEIPGTPPRRHL